jgi:ComF family protein
VLNRRRAAVHGQNNAGDQRDLVRQTCHYVACLFTINFEPSTHWEHYRAMAEMPTDNLGRNFAASIGTGFARLKRGGGMFLDALLPPQCLCCGAMVDRQGNLCAPCWSSMQFLEPPCCRACGFPFPHYEFGVGGEELLCPACTRRGPDFDRARAVLAYDDHSRALLLRLKHGDRLDGVPAFGQWLARTGTPFWADADMLLPVPLHRWRLIARRYNQAALLVDALARHCGVPCEPNILQRRRPTPSQGGRSRAGRFRNVRGAFSIAEKDKARLRGSHVVLIDDVYTTGATVSACARVLRRNGVAHVDVLTLARVL